MWFTRVSIANPVMAVMVMLAFVVLGLFSYQRLAIDQFPNIDIPTVVVAMEYPGASPEIVEAEVTKKVEEAVNTVAGISSLYSRSYEGSSVTIIEFNLDSEWRQYGMAELDFKFLFESLPGLYMVLDPNLRVVAATDAYLQATMTRRADIVGRHVFEVFPDNPDDPAADAVRNSHASFNRVLQTRVADAMVVQRRDVRKPESEGGGFEVRYWSPVNSPLLNPDGTLAYIIHRVENVTEFVLLKQQQGVEQAEPGEVQGLSPVQAEADLYSRSREVAETSLKLEQANEGLSDDLAKRAGELQAILDAAPVAVWIAHDPQCLRITGNAYADQFVMQTGRGGNVSRSALPGDEAVSYRVFRNGVELRPEDLPAQVAATTGRPVKEGEFELVFADGRTVHMLMGAVPLYDGEGRVRGSVAAGVDITDRKHAEAQVSRSERTFSELVARAPFGMYIVDSQFRIAHMNAGSQAGAFQNVRPVIGRAFGEAMRILWPEHVAAEIIAAFRHTLETGEPYYSPRFFNPRHDVDTVEGYEWELHRMTLPDGQYGVICYYFDSTKLRQTEAALLESEERLRMTLDAGQIGTFEFFPQTGKLLWDDQNKRIWGIEAGDEWRYPEAIQRVHPEDREATEHVVTAALDPGSDGIFECEYRILLPDGGVHWTTAKGRVYFEGEGENRRAIRMVGIQLDTTARRCAEQALTADLAALTRMHSLSTSLLESAALEPLLQQIMDAAVAIMEAERGTLQLVEGDSLRIVAHHGHQPPFLDFFASAEDRASVCGEAMKRGESVTVEDVESSPIFTNTPSLPVLREAAVRAVYSTPLQSRNGALLGILTAQWSVPHLPAEHDQWRVDLLVRQAADLIEHHRAEAALRESEERFRSVAENISEGLMVFDAQGNFTYQNPASLRIHGFGIAQAGHVENENLPATWQGFDDTGRPLSFEEWPFSRVLRGERFHDQILRAVRAETGQEFYASYNGCPIFDANDRMVFGFIMIREITEQRKAEVALRQSELEQRRQREFLATLLDYAPYGISVRKGRDLRYEMVNPVYQAIVGSDVALVGRTYREVFPEAAAAGAEAKLRHVIESGEPWIFSRFRAPIPGKNNAVWDGQVVRLPAAAGDEPSILAISWDVTEQAAAEEAIRQQAELLKISFDAIIVWRLDGGIESWNFGAERLYGFSESEALGRVTHELLATVHAEPWDRIKTEIRDRGSWEGELRHHGRDGREVIVSARLQLFRDAEGIEHVLETNRDITDRKQAEEALAASEGRVRALLESAPLAIVAINESGRILLVNGTTEVMFGYSRTELLGESLELLVPEHLREVHAGHLASYFTNPRTRPMGLGLNLRARKKDGTRMPVEVNLSFVEERGTRLGLALITDITERKRGEAALQESEERFRTLADNIPQLAWMADGDGVIFWYNQRWHNYTGIAARRAWDWLEFLHPDHTERVRASLLQSFASREEWEDTFPLRRRDGQYRWFLSRAIPIRNDSDIVVRWFGTSTDVTEQKHSESALRRTNHDLQQFAYVASHDLREPLRNITNYAGLLSRIYKDESQSALRETCIEVVTGAATRMNALIGDLLAYARATDKDIAHEPVDMNRVMDEAMTNLEAAILEAGAVVTRDSLPTVRGDQAQLVQVLQNLTGNSLKYRRPNVPLHIHVTAEPHHDEWLLCVRDNGEGFKPEYSERVFEIFKRLHGSEVPGTGIGLSICRAIVDRHGGRIWADALPGAGARFYFTLKRLPS